MLSAILTGRGIQTYIPQTDPLVTYFHGFKSKKLNKKEEIKDYGTKVRS